LKNKYQKYCEVRLGWLTLCNTHWCLHMGELVEIVDSLENKVSKLLHKLELLHKANSKLKEELNLAKEENQLAQSAVLEWEEKYDSLKMANTMLGSNTNKTEAKLKINTLIRELDVCIAKLAD
jgi:hypothetical protein